METFSNILSAVDDFVWGPVMLVLLVGTAIFLTVRTRFLTWRNLGYALKSVLGKEARTKKRGTGDVSPFSALTTALAATIGTGNIVGVATAMVAGGPGALVWMWISALFGLTSKFSECMLAIKYREVNEKGEMSGGPMYTLKHAFKNKKIGNALGYMFALFAVIASFGIGNLTQANSISSAVDDTFHVSPVIVGIILTVLALVIILGGITVISKVSSVVVPLMGIFYVIAGLIVIALNFKNIPSGVAQIFKMAFSPTAVAGGVGGTITASILQSMRWGVARGVFSNEAGLGSAAITAAAATTDNPVRQGYINMTGTFFDTIVVCTITGLAIASSGVLGTLGADGNPVTGAALTIAAFSSALGKAGAYLVTIGIILFAFSTILGWEYHGEKAFEYLFQSPKFNIIYRIVFSLIVYVGATTSLDIVWNFSDIANALMAIPNLICLLALSKEIAKDLQDFQVIIKQEKEEKKLSKNSQTSYSN
ncbi:MAG: alanine/glycine:cation symporter family protein [Lachnospiraceae bacterium]